MITLILGGEKSGKSGWALQHLLQAPGSRLFVGTARARDLEMRRRIREHRRDRPAHLPAREADIDLPAILSQEVPQHGAILVDSLDFWLFSCVQTDQEELLRENLLDCLRNTTPTTHLILVSSEIGFGPIQATPQARSFVRSLGLLNQQVAALADEVVMIVAGLPLWLKGRN
ncbi:adenosylcobinamide kinase /adenosylcobinamide-phosphate guanylyltransferase [Desulfonatronum thiosulfatophilum]|uniref:Adenosylcobinamide kinase n=1 Tax=Desulfonatronum thiosulfatophilum TaxID=617002 RepID=A0A1G6B961_9BACT|nr:bifunctional adenosylcobinamide kinase/adenosylcobinamide-phosphate guanylyltransferase [Desulfonatronum thiosulfatophilum]SDB17176.1 adenosylcobinamide kinase /adenosylcobinamide-phosphate guanylyltransferase [Desulfonatronum thiosulfatophilum]